MLRVLLSLVAIAGFAVSARAADPPRAEAFVAQVAGANSFEIESAKLALDKSKVERVRGFATMMVSDHSDAGTKFKQAVAEAKLKAPPEGMDAKHKAIYEDLRKHDGDAFDKAYFEAQYKGHVETVQLFEAYADKGDNARLKQFARDLLPALKRHLEHVSKLRAGGA